MSRAAGGDAAVVEPRAETGGGESRLAVLLAMAMFVLAVDTSLMNVSIASVVHDLHTTVSSVQVGDRARGSVWRHSS